MVADDTLDGCVIIQCRHVLYFNKVVALAVGILAGVEVIALGIEV